MRSIKRRIAFHFSLQFIFMVLLVATVLLTVLFFVIEFVMNQEINHAFPDGLLDAISTETTIEEDHTEIGKVWLDQLKAKNMWLQIVDDNGDVIHAVDVPTQIPNHYSIKDILKLEETQVYGDYQIGTYLDALFYDKPYYFILGYQNKKQELLLKWIEYYNKDGQVPEQGAANIAEELEQFEGYFLDIINSEGEVLKRFGESDQPLFYTELQITAHLDDPLTYGTSIEVERVDDQTWILHTPLNNEQLSYTTIQQILIVLIVMGMVILFTLILLAVWHAIRYGQPLILFISWLERMRNGEYDNVFTEKEKKQLFNKKNGVKRRYRLYKEVINEFYDMAEQLASLKKEQALLEQKREEWMAGISHDLRTPLSTIQGYAHLLESSHYEWQDAELIEIGETIRKKSDYMLELIQDFSLISQLKQKELPIHFSTIDLISVIKNCTAKYKEYKTIQIYTPEKPLHVKGSAQWLERLLDNLIINAVKHNPEGTAVVIKACTEGNQVVLTVEDDGMGMDEQTKQNLFTRYYRGTKSEEWTDGSGLGMSIANAIVQAHYSTIHVDSKPSLGTIIRVKFPD
ncbi:sensor histidine kinase [Bacillus suaedae]|uniref:histidine kinase n=1 Tax=Halalkalibacter suaedae TaxID=2822140 RepID=A0A941APQ2_9BACI|nr:HAMP domain-containing sensor histidine kinase [Bacillus suaedae]MBP3953020.1 HAMP domain-containing histidine kinase [Bacillus suaedae]